MHRVNLMVAVVCPEKWRWSGEYWIILDWLTTKLVWLYGRGSDGNCNPRDKVWTGCIGVSRWLVCLSTGQLFGWWLVGLLKWSWVELAGCCVIMFVGCTTSMVSFYGLQWNFVKSRYYYSLCIFRWPGHVFEQFLILELWQTKSRLQSHPEKKPVPAG